MNEALTQLGLLAVAVICNILCGVYYNVNIKSFDFDWYKLMNGVLKACIVGAIALGMATVFQYMPELAESVGVTPEFVINISIVLYASKTMVGLGKILGVKIETKEKVKEVE